MTPEGRIHYLDAVRAILMLLGIPFHVAAIYMLGDVWDFAASDVKSPTLTVFAAFIHVFRMPLFFMVAGYFSMMSLAKSSPGSWLRGRIVKLGVPFLVVGLLLNPVSLAVQPDSARLLAVPGEYWIAHLWFLPTLICLCAVLALMQVTPLHSWFRRGVDWVAERPVTGAVLFVVLTACVSGTASMLGRRLPDLLLIKSTLLFAMGFLPYLLLGAAMRLSPKLLASMSGSSAAAFAATLLPLVFVLYTPWGGFAVNVLLVFAVAMVCLGFARGLLTFGRLTLDNPSRRVRRIADASFTMYLVHLPLLNVFYVVVKRAGLPVFAEFALMVVLVTAASYAVHLLIARSGVLMFLLNGTAMSRSAPTRS